MRKIIFLILLCFSSNLTWARQNLKSPEIIDPEKYIKKHGYHSLNVTNDGQHFYGYTERTTTRRVMELQSEIEKLPKHEQIYEVCNFLRGGVKAKIIEQQGITIDVAVTNYGYSGQTIMCVLKYMRKNKVGTQLFYRKVGVGGSVYTVIVVD